MKIGKQIRQGRVGFGWSVLGIRVALLCLTFLQIIWFMNDYIFRQLEIMAVQ